MGADILSMAAAILLETRDPARPKQLIDGRFGQYDCLDYSTSNEVENTHLFFIPMLFNVCVCVQCQCALTIVRERHRIPIVIFLGRISGHFFSLFPLFFLF